MTVGRHPKGAVARCRGVSEFPDVHILAYISCRSGEYDKKEERMLIDPWLDGYKLRQRNQPFSAINVAKNAVPKKVYEERLKLTEKGWRDADADLKGAA